MTDSDVLRLAWLMAGFIAQTDGSGTNHPVFATAKQNPFAKAMFLLGQCAAVEDSLREEFTKVLDDPDGGIRVLCATVAQGMKPYITESGELMFKSEESEQG